MLDTTRDALMHGNANAHHTGNGRKNVARAMRSYQSQGKQTDGRLQKARLLCDEVDDSSEDDSGDDDSGSEGSHGPATAGGTVCTSGRWPEVRVSFQLIGAYREWMNFVRRTDMLQQLHPKAVTPASKVPDQYCDHNSDHSIDTVANYVKAMNARDPADDLEAEYIKMVHNVFERTCKNSDLDCRPLLRKIRRKLDTAIKYLGSADEFHSRLPSKTLRGHIKKHLVLPYETCLVGHPTAINARGFEMAKHLLDGGSTCEIITPAFAKACRCKVTSAEQGNITLASGSKVKMGGIARNVTFCMNKRKFVVDKAYVLPLFEGVDLLLGAGYADKYDVVHHMKRRQATGLDSTVKPPQVFTIGQGRDAPGSAELLAQHRLHLMFGVDTSDRGVRITIADLRHASRRLTKVNHRLQQLQRLLSCTSYCLFRTL
eukprot:COSAG01_NODE_55_length_31115_cov_105.202533_1_plen_429_part_00